MLRSGGASTGLPGDDEAAFIAEFKLHVTGVFLESPTVAHYLAESALAGSAHRKGLCMMISIE